MINREKFKKRLNKITVGLAIISSVLLLYLAFLQYQNSQCSDSLATLRYNYNQEFFKFLSFEQAFFPALLKIASTTELSTSGVSMSFGSALTPGENNIAQTSQNYNEEIIFLEQDIFKEQQQCNGMSSQIQTFLYLTLFVNVLVLIGDRILRSGNNV